MKYIRRNFVCGLLGREPSCLMDFNTELRQWVDGVANQRVVVREVSVPWLPDEKELRAS